MDGHRPDHLRGTFTTKYFVSSNTPGYGYWLVQWGQRVCVCVSSSLPCVCVCFLFCALSVCVCVCKLVPLQRCRMRGVRCVCVVVHRIAGRSRGVTHSQGRSRLIRVCASVSRGEGKIPPSSTLMCYSIKVKASGRRGNIPT